MVESTENLPVLATTYRLVSIPVVSSEHRNQELLLPTTKISHIGDTKDEWAHILMRNRDGDFQDPGFMLNYDQGLLRGHIILYASPNYGYSMQALEHVQVDDREEILVWGPIEEQRSMINLSYEYSIDPLFSPAMVRRHTGVVKVTQDETKEQHIFAVEAIFKGKPAAWTVKATLTELPDEGIYAVPVTEESRILRSGDY